MLLLIALSACGAQPATQAPTTAPAAPTEAPTLQIPTEAPMLQMPTDAPTEAPLAVAPSANLTEGCVTDYDPRVDYFPAKVQVEDGAGWTIAYFNNYKIITVLNPWRDAGEQFSYVLVQCGTPPPADVGTAQVIEVPVRTIVSMSTTHLPHLGDLGLLDRLVGLSSFEQVVAPAVVEMIEAGELVEIGRGAGVNVEQAIELEPELIMTFGVGNPERDAHPKLLEAGLKVVLNSEYMETTPLGRAEWIKFTAAFFNQEATANDVYGAMAERYNTMAAQARGVVERPTVFTGAPFQGTWYMPGGNSYVARFLADAGADYLWADDDSTGNQQLSFEVVFERAQAADFWLNPSSWQSLADGLTADERFAQFAAFEHGQVFNNNARLNETGGNDYWESGLANPDIVLADLIKIFHPELLPEHELYYHQQLLP
ncbi:ABC transporter substrate-binding protein [Candidatus Viridilinea mediisalina]|uniref:ABC transporter substrate-binding protein n=2 Tax=Candidatus Viridilinea mediisalina TaxID=2024553 RepID=A0A2A6RDQ2_9CHLR|nr:ABC transporter substrate-binding protein [Candidatus Viridilinea mediisalina]